MESLIFGCDQQERLLTECFAEHFGSRAGAELNIFLGSLRDVTLPFDLIEQLRKVDFPGFPGFECGLPPTYHYFIPGSSYGGHHQFPANPIDPGFVAVVDGLGLNYGCPLKLKRGIASLLSIDAKSQAECRDGLRTSTKHLATVEELVTAGIWKQPLEITRSSSLARSYDWNIVFSTTHLNVECKYIPASWPSIVDGQTFELMKGAFAKKAAAQLPKHPRKNSINVAAIATIAPVNDNVRELCRSDLNEYLNVEVILYRDAVGQVTVFSKSKELAKQVHDLLEPWPADEFRGISHVTTNRTEKARRTTARQSSTRSTCNSTKLAEISLELLSPRRIYLLPPKEYPYRYTLEKRLDSGEPIFRYVPPFLQ